MMQTCGLTDGFVLTGIIASIYGQVSVNATRCWSQGVSTEAYRKLPVDPYMLDPERDFQQIAMMVRRVS
jgi:hypothetical protein